MMTGGLDGELASPRTHATGVCISGVGAELPPTVISTAEVEERAGLQRFGFEPGWLERVTGVRERRWADTEVQPSQLAAQAGAKALADAKADPLQVDALLFTGITRDFLEPAVANVVAETLGTRRARVFDLVNACNGLIDGVDVADSLIRSGKARRVLVTTGERASLGCNWQPRTAEEVVLSVAGLVVGDGGGAVVVEATDEPGRGLRAREFRTDATQWRHAIGGRFHPTEPCSVCGRIVTMAFLCHGRELFEASFALMFPMMITVMERSGWGPRDLDAVFCHLPSKRFIENAISHIGGFAKFASKLWSNVERVGNMSTCTLPLAMAEAQEAGVLVPGAKVLILAPSSGISAAAATLVW